MKKTTTYVQVLIIISIYFKLWGALKILIVSLLIIITHNITPLSHYYLLIHVVWLFPQKTQPLVKPSVLFNIDLIYNQNITYFKYFLAGQPDFAYYPFNLSQKSIFFIVLIWQMFSILLLTVLRFVKLFSISNFFLL